MPSVPGTGDKEEKKEAERLRQQAIKEAEKNRRIKYKAQDEEREVIRSSIRDKYKIDAPVNEEEEESEEEDDDGFSGQKKKEEVEEDPVEQARALAEKQLNDAKAMAQEKCVLQ